MILDVSPVLRGETSLLEFEYKTSELPEIDGVVFDGDSTVKGVVDNRAGYMTLRLSASLGYTSSCARCLEEIKGAFDLLVDMPLAVSGSLADEDTDDYIIIVNNSIDCDSLIYETVLLEFPMRVLCDEDCKGLCDVCGCNLNHEKCSCTKKEIDPRLEILAKLLDK